MNLINADCYLSTCECLRQKNWNSKVHLVTMDYFVRHLRRKKNWIEKPLNDSESEISFIVFVCLRWAELRIRSWHTHTRETERKTKLVFAIIKWCAQRIDKGYIYWFSVRPRDVLCFILLIQCIANVYYMTFSSPTCWNFGCIQYMHQYQVIMKCRRWCDRVSEAESKGKSGVSFNILSWF